MLKKIAISLSVILVVLVLGYVRKTSAEPVPFESSIGTVDAKSPKTYTLMSVPKDFDIPEGLKGLSIPIRTVQISAEPKADPKNGSDLTGIVIMPFNAMIGEKMNAWYVTFDGSSASNTQNHFLLVTRICDTASICCE